MRIFYLIFKEIIHRKLNFLLSVLATITAVALFVSFFTTGEASKRETTRLMRDMGFNLRIIPKETDMGMFWTNGFSEHTMPEEYINQFANVLEGPVLAAIIYNSFSPGLTNSRQCFKQPKLSSVNVYLLRPRFFSRLGYAEFDLAEVSPTGGSAGSLYYVNYTIPGGQRIEAGVIHRTTNVDFAQ